MAQKVIIDTDPGVDDAAAIFYALASPELQVLALTTVFGNGTVEESTRNALIILEAASRSDIPVYQGVGKPILRPPTLAHEVHGSNALGGLEFPNPKKAMERENAVCELVKRVMATPGEITLLAIGPLTNVALALSIEPRLATALKELVLMGGAVHVHGNSSEVASANLYNDPEAADIVYSSGAPVVQVGLNVCRGTFIMPEHFERIEKAGTPTCALLTKVTPALRRYYQSETGEKRPEGAFSYNDVPAIAYVLHPELFEAKPYSVRISTRDELTRGQTVADVVGYFKRPPNARVLMNVDREKLVQDFLARVTAKT